MDTLILEDFRCFAGRNEIPIRPLTLLVGENSTGKTSFLAAVRAAHDLRSGTALDFNREPFRLGSYDQIANYRGGRAGRARSFAIGQQFTARKWRFGDLWRPGPHEPTPPKSIRVRIEAGLTSVEAQPTISYFSILSDEHVLQFKGLESDRPVVSFSVDDRVVLEHGVEIGKGMWAGHARIVEDFGSFSRLHSVRYEVATSTMTHKDGWKCSLIQHSV